MSAKKIRLLSVLTMALILLASFQPAEAASLKGGSCRNCPGGGGGGTGGSGGQLSQAEIDGLLYMREEEKLARDSYLTLYDEWHLPIFAKIANSEVMHMSRIKDLLDRYGLADPAAGNRIGVFTNPVLQQLYDNLMNQGSQSSTEALRVGVTIEEVDIADLQNYLDSTNKADVIQVYTNLRNASYNHLSAFKNQLGQ